MTRLFSEVALWQTLVVFALVAMVWVKEVLDVPHPVFGATPRAMDWLGAMVMTIGVLSGGIIVVGHTYLQQRRILRGFISVCSYCRKVHVDKATWQQMEEFLEDRTRAEFTHGICPVCYDVLVKQIESDVAHDTPS